MSPAPERPTRVRYGVMVFLCVLAFLSYFDRNCIMRVQGLIQQDLSLSDSQMGFVFSAFWLAYSFLEIPAGWLGDRYGPRLTLTRIVLCWSLFTALTGSAAGFASLLLCRLLFGAGEAGAFPNIARAQSQWLPQATRARMSGFLWLLARWGGAFAPLIFGSMLRGFESSGFRSAMKALPGGSLLAGAASWRLAFWAAGLIGVVWCVAFYAWFRDRPEEKPTVNAAELELIRSGGAVRGESHRMPAHAWRALFTSRGLWAMGLLYVANSFAWSFFVSWMPRYLKDVHGLAYQQSEIDIGLPLFFGGISCLLGGFLSDRFVRRTGRKWLGRALFPICGYTTAAACMFGVRLVDSRQEAVVLLCLAAAAGDFGQGANWATIVDIGGRYAGTAAGFINMVGNSGNSLQPVIGERIFNTLGWGALFGVYSGMYLVAAGMWLLIDPRRSFDEASQVSPSHPGILEENPSSAPTERGEGRPSTDPQDP